MTFKKIVCRLLSFINKLLPKFNRVVVEGYPNTESNAISVANYISENYDLPVYYVVFNNRKVDPSPLLSPDVIVLNYFWGEWNNINYFVKYLTSRYIFFTHGSLLDFFSGRQTVTNIWHGVLYKRVRVLNGQPPLLADVTVATSRATIPMFAKAFRVPEDSVYVSGYPRNDMLLEAKKNKHNLKERIDGLNAFSKVVIWMPTYRKSTRWVGPEDGVEVGNPFYIKNFNVSHFNKILKENSVVCLVKPHPYAPVYKDTNRLSNIYFIDNEWIACQGVTLYQLLGCTDLLVSDVSSVIIDYMLLDQPIICVSTDFEEYRETRGFYFEDIEKWIPSRINTTQERFFDQLEDVLKRGGDPSKKKREKLKTYFFDQQDTQSTERLVKYVLGNS